MALRGRAKVFGGEWVVRAARNASSLRGGAEVLGKGVSLCGASGGLRWGMGREVGGECIAHPLCGAVFFVSEAEQRGRAKVFGGECMAQPAGVRRRGGGAEVCGKGVRKCSGSARRCAGREQIFDGNGL